MGFFRTDLAVESGSLSNGMYAPGVHVQEEGFSGEIKLTRVQVSPLGEAYVNKPAGTYTTLECEALLTRDPESVLECARLLSAELKNMTPFLTKDSTVLVIGLGNRDITPDALGPLTVNRILVTRHLMSVIPDSIDNRLRSVCAFAPGVMGITGIETMEVVKGIVEHVHPDMVICIDALAARAAKRICTTIQIANTGLAPGSGVGNRRMALNQETLGIPVFSMGVPMVVYASTISHDVLSALLEQIKATGHSGSEAATHELFSMEEEALQALVNEVTQASIGDLVVTPKDVDEAVTTLAHALSLGLNLALHEELTEEEIMAYLA